MAFFTEEITYIQGKIIPVVRAKLLELAWVYGQPLRVQAASYMQLGCMYRHLSPNLQDGKDLGNDNYLINILLKS